MSFGEEVTEKLQSELRMVDEALARRPALADAPNRYAAIERACKRAGEADAAEARLKQVEGERFFWVVERFVDGKGAGYWEGGNSRNFTDDIDKAVQFRRKQDAVAVTFGWHWNDVKITEHSMLLLTPPEGSKGE